MSQIIVFTNRIELKTLLEMECKGATGMSAVFHQNEEDFKAMLDLFEAVEILIVDDPTAGILDCLRPKQEKCKNLLVLSDIPSDLKKAKAFTLSGVENCLNHLKTLLKKDSGSEEGYISIPVGSLVHFKILPCDLFLKLSDDKYVKRIPAHEEFDLQTILSLEEKGVKELYFDKKFNRDFTMMLLNNMINKVEKEYTNVDEKFKASNEVFHTTREIVSKMGFPQRILEVAETVVNRITEDVKKERGQTGTYLNQLRTNKDLGFRYRFAELTSFIATQIADGMPHGGQDPVKNVVFASLFCDVSLKDRSHIHIRSAKDLEKLTGEEKKDVNEHAMRAAEIVAKSKNAPIESEKIIKQHHGSLNGVGFPAEISPKLSPLSLCMMAAQEIAYGVLIEPEKNTADVLAALKETHKGTPLEEYLLIFEKNTK